MAALPWTRALLCLAVLLHSRTPASAQDEAVLQERVQEFSSAIAQPDPAVTQGPEAESVLVNSNVPSSVPEIQEGPLDGTLLQCSTLEVGMPCLTDEGTAKPEMGPDKPEEQQNSSLEGEEEAGRGCNEDLPPEKMRMIAEAMLKFTVDLVREVELEKQQDNLFLSPLSITLALAHLALGAANHTEKALLEMLHLEKVPCLHQALSQVHRQLDKAMLSVAARLYLQKGFQVKEKFLEDSERFYKAKPALLSGNGEEDLAAINNWVKEATRGQIPKILSELPVNVAMILLNAVHFQGFWKTKFDPELTEPGMFYLDDEFAVSVEMMKAPKYALSWYNLDSLEVQVARFPFKGNMSFVAIVPNHFERNVSQLLSDLCQACHFSDFPKERPTMVKMPKLHLQDQLELNQAISQLGLGELFSSPDFRRIAEGPLFVSSIWHHSALELAETGVEASAATSVVMSRSLSTFILNQPFVFLILDDTTGIPLFFGSIRNPNPSAPKQRKEQEELPDKQDLAHNTIPK
ncbi:alpha-2-antiplasmin isoform X2 [Eublepharis macularius]|uniref:Alpha-2-antiplasmin isoform X2 n=1 Tax=Eublepharis macularius TaxID=481883 RepID=A0AA97KMF4_EUBMA|nr:alpha-2-antiplasmin isoform X2 [Eublepharis macularius]